MSPVYSALKSLLLSCLPGLALFLDRYGNCNVDGRKKSSMCLQNQLSISEDNGANSLDLCRIFAQRLNSLYKLAFLLTTNHSLAERCTIAGLDEALTLNGISNASAESWSKRAIIQNALRIVRTESFKADVYLRRPQTSNSEITGWPFSAIIRLKPLERFVFVLSVLEKISDQECSQLLGCAATAIVPARIRALEFLSIFEASEKEQLTGRCFSSAVAYSGAMPSEGEARPD